MVFWNVMRQETIYLSDTMFKKLFSVHILAAVTGLLVIPTAPGFSLTEPPQTKQLGQEVVTQDIEAAGYFQQGVTLYNLRNLEGALVAFRQALERDPKIALAYYYLGNVLSEKGRSEEAIAEYQRALKINPNLAEAQYNLGVIYYQQGRLDDAIDAYDRAIGINPDDAGAYYLSLIHI